MRNKVLLFMASAVITVVIFFICALVFQYFDTGIIDYSKATRFALIYGLVLIVVREVFDYFRKKKQ